MFMAAAALCVSCGNAGSAKKDKKSATRADKAQNALDWEGTYMGNLPVASGEAMTTIITLNNDMTFVYVIQPAQGGAPLTKKEGLFTWRQDQLPVIAFVGDDLEGFPRYYFVGENYLDQLDMEGKAITGKMADLYRLDKVTGGLLERYWKCVEIGGKAIAPADEHSREVHMIFKAEDNRVFGNAGCNNFNGSYTLDGKSLKFGHAASTMMACPDLDTEQKFFAMLPEVSGYRIADDTLWLLDKDGKVLAEFKEVLLR